MTFTMCGVIVGSRILLVACHTVGSCVNCENTTCEIIDLALTRTTAVQFKALHYSIYSRYRTLSLLDPIRREGWP